VSERSELALWKTRLTQHNKTQNTTHTTQQYSVIKIQSWARMLIAVQQFIDKRNKKRASTRIQMTWRRVLALCRVRSMLVETRTSNAAKWNTLKKELVDNFDSYAGSSNEGAGVPHTILHIPSLSIDEYLRLGMNHFTVRQNLQMSRLADLCRNPNCEVRRAERSGGGGGVEEDEKFHASHY